VGDGSLDTLAGVLRDWLDTLGLSQVHLVGHSLGGALVLALALQCPDRPLSCTLIASAALGSEIDAEFVDGMVQADRRRQLKPHLERLFADPGLATRPLVDDVLKFKRVDGVRAALQTIAGNLIADGKQSHNFRERLQEIAAPMLVLWGSQDHILPASHASDLDQRCTVEVLDDCGHMVQMENPAEVNRLIVDFLRNHD
jgi:pyruvate dehydrogenase E2 component (dihydrolipoamide acetyltransferase)